MSGVCSLQEDAPLQLVKQDLLAIPRSPEQLADDLQGLFDVHCRLNLSQQGASINVALHVDADVIAYTRNSAEVLVLIRIVAVVVITIRRRIVLRIFFELLPAHIRDLEIHQSRSRILRLVP